EIPEDERQRVIVRCALAQKVQRIREGAAAPTPELSCHPAQEQRVAAGLRVQGTALGFAGPGQQRIVLGEVGKERERSGLVELGQGEEVCARAEAAAAGEDRLTPLRQAPDKGQELVAVGPGEGFEVVEKQQDPQRAEGVQEESDTLVLRRLHDVRLLQLTRQL